MQFDIIAVGDLRFPGGSSTALAQEVLALSGAGYRVALMAMAGEVLRYPHPVHPEIRALIDAGKAWLVPPDQPIEAQLCLLHHPQVFSRWPLHPPRIKAEQTVLITHHPLMDAADTPYYDWAQIDMICRALFGEVVWAPVGPKVRAQFANAAAPPKLHPHDWLNVVDCDAWAVPRAGFMGARPQIGRHSRPDPMKWPADRAGFLAAYPDDARIDVRLMGWGAALDAVVGRLPRNWQVLPFNAQKPRRFLAQIDMFVYHHHPLWVEAYGRAILEAMASGVVPVLPAHFRPLFGDGAVYCAPDAVRDTVLELHSSPVRFLAQAERSTAWAREHGDTPVLVNRVSALIGPPRSRQPGSRNPSLAQRTARRPKVMFFTSNGVGMGHLTRALAVARRLPETVEPVFFSLSKAFGLAARDGIHAEYLPHHKSIGLHFEEWNIHLERELAAALAFHRPDVFVFDGNVPYAGLLGALARYAEHADNIWKVWMRRGFWAPGSGADTIGREANFDAVIEPQDIAQAWDRGITTQHRAKTYAVPPVRYSRTAELLDRAAARAEMGLPADGLAVLVQLGAGNNFDMAQIRDHILARLTATPDLHVVLADWLIAETTKPLPEGVSHLQTFPLSRLFAGFDFSISAVGYNSFHEILGAGLPCLFIPNQAGEQDEQVRRAQYAAVNGLALFATSFDTHGVDQALVALMDEARRADMRAACNGLDSENGANSAARYIADLAFTRRQREAMA